MKKFYVDLHLVVSAMDADDALDSAEEVAVEALGFTGILESRVGEMEECEPEEE